MVKTDARLKQCSCVLKVVFSTLLLKLVDSSSSRRKQKIMRVESDSDILHSAG